MVQRRKEANKSREPHDLWKPRVKHPFGAAVRFLDPGDIEEKLEKRLGDEAKTASDDTLRWDCLLYTSTWFGI